MEGKKMMSLEELEAVVGGRKGDPTCEVYCTTRCGFSRLFCDETEAVNYIKSNHRRCPNCNNELLMMLVD